MMNICYYFRNEQNGSPGHSDPRRALHPGRMGMCAEPAVSEGVSSKDHHDGRRWYLEPTHCQNPESLATYGAALARSLSGTAYTGTGKGRSSSRPQSESLGEKDSSCSRSHVTHHTTQCYPLEHAQHGRSPRAQPTNCSSDLEAIQPQASSHQNLQGQPRQTLRREAL